MPVSISKTVCDAYENYVFDWNYLRYLLVGGYGSAKSYHTALKIILKLFQEKRKCLVVREVYETHRESTYDLLSEILEDMGLLTDNPYEWKKNKTKVLVLKNPMEFKFPNGSRIIFKGMDKEAKVKSINGVSIVWLEECSEIRFSAVTELLGRVRTPDVSIHFIFTCNPVDKLNWVYRYFFISDDTNGKRKVIVDDEYLYKVKCLVKRDTYYLHTVPDDNNFLPIKYLRTLDELQSVDPDRYRIARLGRFGTNGEKVLPNIIIASNKKLFKSQIYALGEKNMYFGFDFGFAKSFNAITCCSVDSKHGYLYIWDEIYVNHLTDLEMAERDDMQKLKERLIDMNQRGFNKMIVADNEDPKAIQFYKQCGFPIRACRNKFAGSRLSNTRKMKRFRRIFISPKCKNTIKELKDLVYKKDREGNLIYDEFNIDSHELSALWYALDTVTVADVKDKKYYSKNGG